MASITPNNQASSQQLNLILGSTPMPLSGLQPNGSMIIGGVSDDGHAFAPSLAQATSSAGALPVAPVLPGSGQIVVGGGTTPAVGAQPPAPGSASVTPGVAATPDSAVTGSTPSLVTTPTTAPAAAAEPELVSAQGFGRADKDAPMRVSTGGSSFTFPSFNASAKSTGAPAISWDTSWKRVEKDGMWYMEAPNGVKAIPAVEYRMTPRPAAKVQTVQVANGWGKKFPDGSIVVFDRTEGPYRLDAKGNKHALELGTHTIGGVKVRIFEASVVRTLDPNGKVQVFDSRGNASAGSTRSRIGGALGSAQAGASTLAGGKPGTTTAANASTSGGGKTAVGGGGTTLTTAQLTQNIQHITEAARGMLAEIQSGSVDSTRLAALQAQLNALPAGLLQSIGAAGTMTTSGATTNGAATSGTTLRAANVTPTPATSTLATPVGAAAGDGAVNVAPAAAANAVANPTAVAAAAGGAPTAGNDANSTVKTMAAGAKVRVDVQLPAELAGKQARFAQLPAEVQTAVAKALGSDQGAGALKADQLVAFSKNGEVSLVGGGTVYVKHQAQVRGAGPGEELALTVRPGRQPGAARQSAVTGGGASANASASSASSSSATTRPTTGPAVTGGGSTSAPATLFAAGNSVRSVDFGGIEGSFTFATLPAKARTALVNWFRENPANAASKAFAAHPGWSFSPGARMTISAGFMTFVDPLTMVKPGASRPTTTIIVGDDTQSRPPVSGGGASSSSSTVRPPIGAASVTGGGTRPNVAPPAPPINDPGEQPAGHVGH